MYAYGPIWRTILAKRTFPSDPAVQASLQAAGAGAGRAPLWLAAAALLVCTGYLAAELFLLGRLGFPLDDSWIHLQFARNLAAGEGLAYNPGELVTGSTAPLWTALLALLFWLPGDVVAWTKLAGVALHLIGVDATWRLARELGLGRGLAALAAGLTLATGPLAWSAVSGMEIPLFIALSLWGMILHLRERAAQGSTRPPLSFAVLALAALARPEGLLLLALAGLDRLLVFRRVAVVAGVADGSSGEPAEPARPAGLALARPPLRPLLIGAALAAGVLAGPILVYAWAGGSVLPTTFAVKAGTSRNWIPEARLLFDILGILWRPQPVAALLAAGGVLALVERLGTPRDRGLLPALWLLGLPLVYSAMSPGGDKLIAGNFGRYYFPLFPPLLVLAALALERAWQALGSGVRLGRLRLPLRALLVALLAAPTLLVLVQGAGRYVQNVANVEDSDVAIARWLSSRLPPEALLAVNDIGAIKYLLPNRVVDLVGIASPDLRRETAAAARAGTPLAQALFEALERRRPDYLVIFPEWFPELAADPRFRPLHQLVIRDNITMGGDEVVVYATPWTRYPLREVSLPSAPPSDRIPAPKGDS